MNDTFNIPADTARLAFEVGRAGMMLIAEKSRLEKLEQERRDNKGKQS